MILVLTQSAVECEHLWVQHVCVCCKGLLVFTPTFFTRGRLWQLQGRLWWLKGRLWQLRGRLWWLRGRLWWFRGRLGQLRGRLRRLRGRLWWLRGGLWWLRGRLWRLRGRLRRGGPFCECKEYATADTHLQHIQQTPQSAVTANSPGLTRLLSQKLVCLGDRKLSSIHSLILVKNQSNYV